jgi:hypothetical protein
LSNIPETQTDARNFIKPLAEQMKENPEAFNFDDVELPAEARGDGKTQNMQGLNLMLNIPRQFSVFQVIAPKIKETLAWGKIQRDFSFAGMRLQTKFLAAQENLETVRNTSGDVDAALLELEAITNELANYSDVHLLARIATQILKNERGENATCEQIMEACTADELNDLVWDVAKIDILGEHVPPQQPSPSEAD